MNFSMLSKGENIPYATLNNKYFHNLQKSKKFIFLSYTPSAPFLENIEYVLYQK